MAIPQQPVISVLCVTMAETGENSKSLARAVAGGPCNRHCDSAARRRRQDLGVPEEPPRLVDTGCDRCGRDWPGIAVELLIGATDPLRCRLLHDR